MSLTDDQRKQLKGWGLNPESIEPTPQAPVKKRVWPRVLMGTILGFFYGLFLFGAVTFLGYAEGFMTDGQCLEDNQESFINGTIYGNQVTMFQILNHTAQCEQPLPIEFQNQTYNLFLVECLNLNSQTEVQK